MLFCKSLFQIEKTKKKKKKKKMKVTGPIKEYLMVILGKCLFPHQNISIGNWH